MRLVTKGLEVLRAIWAIPMPSTLRSDLFRIVAYPFQMSRSIAVMVKESSLFPVLPPVLFILGVMRTMPRKNSLLVPQILEMASFVLFLKIFVVEVTSSR